MCGCSARTRVLCGCWLRRCGSGYGDEFVVKSRGCVIWSRRCSFLICSNFLINNSRYVDDGWIFC